MAQFTNQATLLYNGVSLLSNVTAGEILESLAMTKTPVRDTYAAGDSLVYAVSVVNSGEGPFTELTFTDNLGAYEAAGALYAPLTYVEGTILYYVNGQLQLQPQAAAGDALTVTGLSVPAGGSAMLVYQARVNEYAPLLSGGEIVNEAALSGGGLAQPVTASATVRARDEARLSVAKSMYPTVVTENGSLAYTFLIQNSGNATSDPDGAVLTDTFDPILNDIAVTFNGDPWTQGVQYSYDQTTGEFHTLPGYIQVPAAAFSQDRASGLWNMEPGCCALVVRGAV